jgi:hypothetical protein
MSWASEIRLAVWSSRASFITTEFSRKKDYGAKRILCFFLHCVVLKIRLNLFNHHSRWTRWVPLPFMRPKQSCLPLSRLTDQNHERKSSHRKEEKAEWLRKKMIKFEFASGDTNLISNFSDRYWRKRITRSITVPSPNHSEHLAYPAVWI